MSAARPPAGYSGTPLPQKLAIKPGARLAILGAPERFDETLGPLPPGVDLRGSLRGGADVVVFFTTRRRNLERRFAALAWPKRASGVATDMTEDVVREVALPHGLVDNKVAAIDATWSGLRLVYRLERRRRRR